MCMASPAIMAETETKCIDLCSQTGGRDGAEAQPFGELEPGRLRGAQRVTKGVRVSQTKFFPPSPPSAQQLQRQPRLGFFL